MKRSDQEFGPNSGAWVDFNSLDFEGCWVSGGPNVTCPYRLTGDYADNLERTKILVCVFLSSCGCVEVI